jgi:hypothetical protein
MANYISHGELVTTAKREGYPVDDTVPREVLLRLLGGLQFEPEVPTPVLDAAVKLHAFAHKYRDRLNVACDTECLTCPAVMVATCYLELSTVQQEIDEEDSEE